MRVILKKNKMANLKKQLSISLAILLGMIIISCQQTKDTPKDFLPIARGAANVILVVMDTAQWNGPLGKAVKEVYGEYVPGLPQEEPYFKVRNINPLKLNHILKSAKNMIFVMTLDNKSKQNRSMHQYFTSKSLKKIQTDTARFMLTQKDNFARGQQMMHLFANSEELLIDKLKKNKSQLRNHFVKIENGRLAQKIFKKREKGIEKTLKDKHGFTMNIPFGYELAQSKADFVWIRLLDLEFEKNIFVYYKPFDSKEPFDDPLWYREQITSEKMRDIEKPEIYMTLQGAEYSQVKEVNFKGKYSKETRGLWKLSDISGGGPFVSYVFVDESQRRMYYLEGYVYAPSQDKRVFMQEMEAIVNSFKSGEELAAK